MSEKLAHRFTVSEVVRVYNKAVERIRGGFAMIDQADTELNETFKMDGSGGIYIREHGGRTLGFDSRDCESALFQIRHEVWSCIIDRLEIRRMMSIKRWDEIQEQIKKRQLPEITEESVAQLVRGFEAHLMSGVMIEEAVQEVFEWLRPRRSKYKTNSELEIPSRVILSWMVERCEYGRSSWRVSYRCEQDLIALENVIRAIRGDGVTARASYSAISNVISAEGFDGVGETDLFRFRCCKNRNLHLEFKDRESLARFNAIAGGRRLRPAAAE
jgi:hypothetical protein